MPYTLAHPAVILPFRKMRCLTFSGLFIGSLSPDFEYLIRLDVKSLFSHSFSGLFWFCLPLGLIAVLLYRTLWRPVLASLFPLVPKSATKILYWQDVPSILLGAITHIVWDSFTHENRFGPRNIEILNLKFRIGETIQVPFLKILQHGSTAIGLGFLIYFTISESNKIEPLWWQNRGKKVAGFFICLAMISLLVTNVFWEEESYKKIIVLSANNFIVLIGVIMTFLALRRRALKAN